MSAQSPTLFSAVLKRPDAARRPWVATKAVRAVRRLGVGKPDPLGWLLGPALLLLVWTLGSMSGLIDARILPAPWATVSTAADLIHEGRLQANLAISAWRAAQGLAFGVVAGVLVALASGLSLWGGYVFDGLVQVKRAIPVLALIPLIVLWFGIGETMKVTVIAISVFIPIYLNTHAALRGIETRYVELAETLGLSRWTFVRQVVLPGALPGFLLGLRFAVMAAWLALVVVEQLNATSGIGYMINLARTYAQSDVIVVGLVVYALLGLTSDLAVRQVETRALAWRRTFGR
ncbi:ABC transporter permease [Phenylobacterium sp.]|uniref:ABC transporter permease n=1 Tax=Phenylobacterium sp. TaxID=1871053 RepID=UPI0011FA6546|nr:ABC transporter permease [Phenylobacterium sp.]THD54147.1 MAG: ABC transporter permease [Phenylobacterium sp.]